MSRSEVLKNMRSLSGLLNEWGFVKNPNSLYKISVEQIGNKISYTISDSEPLIFYNIDIEKHTIPHGLDKLSDSDIDIRLKLTSVFGELISEKNLDPIQKLGVNIVVDATYLVEGKYEDVTCCWHLDRHNFNDSEFTHPTYHMTFGGSNMKKYAGKLGKLLLMPAPRIMYPPMELILSCDFIIRNFYSKEKRESIIEKPGYIELVEKAKIKYWKPYGCAFVSEWVDSMEIENLTHGMLIGA